MPKRIRPRSLPSRISFKRVDDAEAKVLLEQYGSMVQALAREWARLSHGCGTDDLIAVGQVAVLEAHVTYRDTEHANRDTWTRRVVKWRISEESRRHIEIPDYDATQALQNGETPEELYATAFAREAIGRLDVRKAVILQARLHGYTCEEVGTQLGISPQLVSKKEHAALAELRAWAEGESEVE